MDESFLKAGIVWSNKMSTVTPTTLKRFKA